MDNLDSSFFFQSLQEGTISYIWRCFSTQKQPDVNFFMRYCGDGEQCPALAQSRFGGHVRGDKPSSQRLHDNMLSGTVPIFTLKEQFDHRPFWIDWDKLSYFADIQKEETFLATIDTIQ